MDPARPERRIRLRPADGDPIAWSSEKLLIRRRSPDRPAGLSRVDLYVLEADGTETRLTDADAYLTEGFWPPRPSVPLLYATTKGHRYERFEIGSVEAPAWPAGVYQVTVRLFARGGKDVMEETLFVWLGSRGQLTMDPGGARRRTASRCPSRPARGRERRSSGTCRVTGASAPGEICASALPRQRRPSRRASGGSMLCDWTRGCPGIDPLLRR